MENAVAESVAGNAAIGTSLLFIALLAVVCYSFVLYDRSKRSQEEKDEATTRWHDEACRGSLLVEQLLHALPAQFIPIRLEAVGGVEQLTLTSREPFRCTTYWVNETVEGNIFDTQDDGVAKLLGTQYVLKLTLPENGDYLLWFGRDASDIRVHPQSTVVTQPPQAVAPSTPPQLETVPTRQLA